jgi:uncharacterized damage-inducible protein DinB
MGKYSRWRELRHQRGLFRGSCLLVESQESTALTHIVWAEWIWLRRWKGTSPQVVFDAEDFPHVGTLRARWVDIEIEQRAFIETMTTESLLGLVQYVNLQGEAWRYPLWRQMYHVVNHSSYHRGQLTTMLRQLAARSIPTDFLVFHDELDPHPA